MRNSIKAVTPATEKYAARAAESEATRMLARESPWKTGRITVALIRFCAIMTAALVTSWLIGGRP